MPAVGAIGVLIYNEEWGFFVVIAERDFRAALVLSEITFFESQETRFLPELPGFTDRLSTNGSTSYL
jgi:hypothetical protein